MSRRHAGCPNDGELAVSVVRARIAQVDEVGAPYRGR